MRAFSRRGQALVEFTLVLPIAVVMLLGVLEIGWMLFNQSGNLNAAREAARTASLGYDNERVQTIAQQNSWALPISAVVITVTDQSGAIQPSSDRTKGNIVKVETVITFSPLTRLFSFVPAATVHYLRAGAVFQID